MAASTSATSSTTPAQRPKVGWLSGCGCRTNPCTWFLPVSIPGSLRSLDPATGTALWVQPLGCMPNGSPTVDVTTQVLAVPLYGPCSLGSLPGVALYDATAGTLLTTLATAGKMFAQPVFAEGKIFVADETGKLVAYGL